MKTSRVRVDADEAGLERIFHAYDGFARKHKVPDAVRRDVYVALEEIVSNVWRHGAKQAEKTPTITLRLAIDRGALNVRINDNGPAFDPFASAPAPDVTQALMDRPIGGLGVLFVQRLTDSHAYARRGERNCVTLTRALSKPRRRIQPKPRKGSQPKPRKTSARGR
ncbi:MAG TPA: ATP-binding protein [Vicinamibacterales bacterium]|nr:ATP-binding protein [Vicinamibacterales bacterium]